MSVYYDLPKPEVVEECDGCGRELPSHHLNCSEAGKPLVATVVDEAEPEAGTCAAEGCQDAPKPYGGKGPRPKYCAAHGS